MFSSIDIALRNLFSYIYRILIILYSLLYIINNSNNYFSNWSYLLFTLLYLILFYLLKKYEKTSYRTLLDYVYIFIIIYGDNINNYFFYFLIIFPLINAQNNSGKTNNFYGYLYSVIILIVFKKTDILFFIPIILILFVDSFLRIRGKIRKISETLFEIVDDFYGKNIGRDDVTGIYNKLIQKIESFIFKDKVGIKFILCFVVKRNNEDFSLVNASDKIIEFDIEKKEELINLLSEKNQAENFKIKINNEEYSNTLYNFVKGKFRKYCFVVVFENQNSLVSILKKAIISDLIIIPALKHLARVFEIQNWINNNKNKTLEKIAENQEYVLKANEVMHFVKNSMSPIKDSLTLFDLYEKETNPDNKKFLLEKLIYQRKNAKFEIDNIIKRSDFILEKSKNPFEADEFEKINSFIVFDHIRKSWDDKVSNGKISIEVNNIDKFLDSTFNTNLNIIDLILINIFSNIGKYSLGGNLLEFKADEDSLLITFSNFTDVKKIDSIVEFKKLIEYYNKNNRIEISKRKSHGFVHLRTYCETIDIKSTIDISDDNRFSFQINLKYYENSSI